MNNTRIKCFSNDKRPQDLENEVNSWLEEMRDIRVRYVIMDAKLVIIYEQPEIKQPASYDDFFDEEDFTMSPSDDEPEIIG